MASRSLHVADHRSHRQRNLEYQGISSRRLGMRDAVQLGVKCPHFQPQDTTTDVGLKRRVEANTYACFGVTLQLIKYDH